MGLRIFSRLKARLLEWLLTDSEKQKIVSKSAKYKDLERESTILKVKYFRLQRRENRISTDQGNLLTEYCRLREELFEEREKNSVLERLAELGRHVQEDSPNLVVRFDKEGVITYINPNTKACINYKGDIVGKKPSQILATKDEALKPDMYFWNYLLGFEHHAEISAEEDMPLPHNTLKVGAYTFRADGYTCSNGKGFSGGSVVLIPEIRAKGFFERIWTSWANPFAITGEVTSDNVLESVYHPIERFGREVNYLDFRKAKVDTAALGTIAKFYQMIKSQGRKFEMRGLPEEQIRLLIDLGVDAEDIKDAKKLKPIPHAEGAK